MPWLQIGNLGVWTLKIPARSTSSKCSTRHWASLRLSLPCPSPSPHHWASTAFLIPWPCVQRQPCQCPPSPLTVFIIAFKLIPVSVFPYSHQILSTFRSKPHHTGGLECYFSGKIEVTDRRFFSSSPSASHFLCLSHTHSPSLPPQRTAFPRLAFALALQVEGFLIIIIIF